MASQSPTKGFRIGFGAAAAARKAGTIGGSDTSSLSSGGSSATEELFDKVSEELNTDRKRLKSQDADEGQ